MYIYACIICVSNREHAVAHAGYGVLPKHPEQKLETARCGTLMMSIRRRLMGPLKSELPASSLIRRLPWSDLTVAGEKPLKAEC
jgi:hypothetical protein